MAVSGAVEKTLDRCMLWHSATPFRVLLIDFGHDVIHHRIKLGLTRSTQH